MQTAATEQPTLRLVKRHNTTDAASHTLPPHSSPQHTSSQPQKHCSDYTMPWRQSRNKRHQTSNTAHDTSHTQPRVNVNHGPQQFLHHDTAPLAHLTINTAPMRLRFQQQTFQTIHHPATRGTHEPQHNQRQKGTNRMPTAGLRSSPRPAAAWPRHHHSTNVAGDIGTSTVNVARTQATHQPCHTRRVSSLHLATPLPCRLPPTPQPQQAQPCPHHSTCTCTTKRAKQ